MSFSIFVASSLAVNSIPPAMTVRPRRITVPRQKPRMPSSAMIARTESMVPVRFACCAFVLTVSKGCVARVVIVPATAPLAKLVRAPSTGIPFARSQSLIAE